MDYEDWDKREYDRCQKERNECEQEKWELILRKAAEEGNVKKLQEILDTEALYAFLEYGIFKNGDNVLIYAAAFGRCNVLEWIMSLEYEMIWTIMQKWAQGYNTNVLSEAIREGQFEFAIRLSKPRHRALLAPRPCSPRTRTGPRVCACIRMLLHCIAHTTG